MPAAQPVAGEELATAWPREAKDVFEVRTRSRDRARDGGIERSAHSAEEQHSGDARTDLEGAVRDVLVRYPIAREVKEQPERQRSEPRTDERAAGRSRRDMKGDDQAATLACGTLDGPPRADGLSWSQISCLVVAQEPKGARTTALSRTTSSVHCLPVSAKHSRILQALREESEALFRINVKVVQLGGEPLPPLPERLRRRRSISPRPERPETAASPRTKRAPPASSTRD